jgi:hypothetical protein
MMKKLAQRMTDTKFAGERGFTQNFSYASATEQQEHDVLPKKVSPSQNFFYVS